MSSSDGHFNRALYDDNVTGKFNQPVRGGVWSRRRLHFPEDTHTHTVGGGIRTAGRTGRHRLDVGIISGKNKISDRKEKELGRRRLGKLVANERQCRWTLLNEQGIVAGTTTTAGIGSRLDGKQRRGHDDDGSQRSRTDPMKTSTGKPPPSFSFFFFFL